LYLTFDKALERVSAPNRVGDMRQRPLCSLDESTPDMGIPLPVCSVIIFTEETSTR
jgi:hypothetical protein